jgi:hypothetical protein
MSQKHQTAEGGDHAATVGSCRGTADGVGDGRRQLKRAERWS